MVNFRSDWWITKCIITSKSYLGQWRMDMSVELSTELKETILAESMLMLCFVNKDSFVQISLM